MRWRHFLCPGILSARWRARNRRNAERHLEVRCVFRRDSGSLTFDVPPSETSRWRAVARVLRSPMDAMSCALLPAPCSLCGWPLPQLSPAPICAVCWGEFPLQTGPCCARCGDTLQIAADIAAPTSAATSVSFSRARRLAPRPFVRAVAYGLYENRMKASIHTLKYERLHLGARGLGRLLAQAIARLAGEAPLEILVIPVPLHRAKFDDRGFNQARALAEQALRFLRKSHPEWQLRLAPGTLMRLRATESQTGLTSRQRRLNVRIAFAVSDQAAVASRHVLLVDDIFTIGATARAAAQALTRAGAATVWVATLARARRVNAFYRGADFGDVHGTSFQDGEDTNEFSGNAPEADTVDASTYSSAHSSRNFSSHDQPSF
jgi:ComF family protein